MGDGDGFRALGAPADQDGTTTSRSGVGRVLVAIYGTFALAAGARAAVQLATRFDQAPVAYLLSAFAAAVYLVATIALARGGRWGRRTALVAITVELIGVLVVGTLSLTDPASFPDETVWSAYGRGYLFIPLVLPVLGLLLLRRTAQKSPPPKSPPPKSPPPKSPPPKSP
ncbi:hypothetical protein [Blastococcus sp. PRF04-17]|uniref:hypothetical protein n=1 Tax=Blastococcus sp. PRF04-17 TaxID=2933797 RepID=UPI001FF60897|nr:hypothetical protein [Blastococcus sp. PRF04-17]UOY04105.1 hypothetical protein MVA48_16665 [Blastococcus sp. PRF04-17]